LTVLAGGSQAEQSAYNIAAEFHETTATDQNRGTSKYLQMLLQYSLQISNACKTFFKTKTKTKTFFAASNVLTH